MAMFGVTIAIAVGAIFIIKYLLKYFKQLRLNYSVPNLGFPYPLVGHSHRFFNVPKEDILSVIMSHTKQDPYHRKMFLIIGIDSWVWFYHPENVEKILNSTVHISKSKAYDYLEPWLGTGLLLSTNEKWRHRRKLLTPAFHFKILEDSLKVFNRQAAVLVEILTKDSKDGQHILDLFPYMCRCTLDIILETAMGSTLDIQHNKESSYAQALQMMIHVMQQRQLIPWLMPDFLFQFSQLKKDHDQSLNILHSLTKSVIKDKREDLVNRKMNETKSASPVAFLDLLLSVKLPDGSMLNDDDIQEEVDTFMFEGHDTTACALSWALFLLGRHPEIQEKLYEEQLSIFADDFESDAEQEHLSKMKYLEACIKEALRLYPSVPIIARKLEEDAVIDGLPLTKGTSVALLVHQLHHNPLIWEDPLKFKPERFLEQSTSRHPYAYVPFSAGPRNCIGQKFALMEEKTVLSKLIRKFTFESLDPVEKMKPVIEIISRPHEGVKCKITPRR